MYDVFEGEETIVVTDVRVFIPISNYNEIEVNHYIIESLYQFEA